MGTSGYWYLRITAWFVPANGAARHGVLLDVSRMEAGLTGVRDDGSIDVTVAYLNCWHKSVGRIRRKPLKSLTGA